jgi:hypothetical protein
LGKSRSWNVGEIDNWLKCRDVVKHAYYNIVTDKASFCTFVNVALTILSKVMHLKEKLVISVPFVIQNFGSSIKALYNHNFVKFWKTIKQNLLCYLLCYITKLMT